MVPPHFFSFYGGFQEPVDGTLREITLVSRKKNPTMSAAPVTTKPATAVGAPAVGAAAATAAPVILPTATALLQAAKLGIEQDKPIKLDFFVDSATNKACDFEK